MDSVKKSTLCSRYIKKIINKVFKKEIWVFGSFKNVNFFHNTKALFLYAHQNYLDKIKVVWITKDRILLKELRENGFNCFLANSILGKLYCLFARYHIIDWGISNTNHHYTCNSIQVNLWHGIPLKKIERDIDKIKDIIHDKKYLKRFKVRFGNPGFMFACSDYDKSKFFSAFNVSPDKIQITGMARNDWLFQKIFPTAQDKKLISRILEIKKTGKQLILYLPTFRDEKVFDIFSFISDNFKEFLETHGIIMFCKMHIADNFVEKRTSCKAVEWFEANVDLYPILNLFDCLITDYSSIYFDFALTGKKIIHFCPDIQEYDREIRGFYINLKDNLGGAFCEDIEGLKNAILGDVNCSAKIIEKFHMYKEGGFCQRIMEYLL